MADLKTRFQELTRMKYVDQAKWFLNGFWQQAAQAEAENIWAYANKFIELDQRKKEGNELDEFSAHKFLESLGETLTVVALREKLRKIDMDANGKMALLEYLLFKYSFTVQQCIDAPQGDNTAEVEEAQAKLDEAQKSLNQLQAQLEEQKRVVAEAQRTKAAAEKALNDQKSAEEAVRRSEEELRNAVNELHAQEESYKQKIKTLEEKSSDPNASTVSKNKAAAELAQVKQEDPLPLRKAKITQEAALRKVEKERKAAEAATAKAAEAHQKADEAAAAAEEQARKVEALVQETEQRYKEAVDFLEEVKRKGGVAHGAIWWMERELKEAQKYLPKKKQQL